MKQILLVPLLAGALGMLAACNSSNDSGSLTLGITDAPVDDAERVVVEFTGITVKPAAGDASEFTFDEPRRIDLLALHGGETELLLDEASVAAGEYEWIRLTVNAGMNASDSFIELEDGSVHALFIPSGNQTGLKLVRGFTVPANGSADFTIDFDLRKSVTKPGQSGMPYILRPALRLVDNTEVGTIAGTVPSETATAAGCTPAVYVYEGSDAVADDIGSENEPVASGIVEMNDGSGAFEYRVAFLEAGDYTVALTCDADDDAADSDDDITFEVQQNAAVETGQVTTVDF